MMLHIKHQGFVPYCFRQEDLQSVHSKNIFIAHLTSFATDWKHLKIYLRGPYKDHSFQAGQNQTKSLRGL